MVLGLLWPQITQIFHIIMHQLNSHNCNPRTREQFHAGIFSYRPSEVVGVPITNLSQGSCCDEPLALVGILLFFFKSIFLFKLAVLGPSALLSLARFPLELCFWLIFQGLACATDERKLHRDLGTPDLQAHFSSSDLIMWKQDFFNSDKSTGSAAEDYSRNQKKAQWSSTTMSQWIKALLLSAWLMVTEHSICICLWRFRALRNRVTRSQGAISGPVSIFTKQSWIGRGGGYLCVSLCSKVPPCHLSLTVELLWGTTTPSRSVFGYKRQPWAFLALL